MEQSEEVKLCHSLSKIEKTLEDLHLKIYAKDATSQIDTIEFLQSMYPNFSVTENLEEADLFWNYKLIRNSDMYTIKKHKGYINRFVGADIIFNKSVQGELMNQCKQQSPEDFKFWPTTYILPRDRALFIEVLKDSEGSGDIWIYKKSNSNSGRGITIIKSLDDFEKLDKKPDAVVQKYILNPLLINKKKFDIRIYIVTYGVNPMRAYVSADYGLVK